jgi:hypothetical protein
LILLSLDFTFLTLRSVRAGNIGEGGQADAIDAGLTLFSDDSLHVAVNMYFCLYDFDSQEWGLMRSDLSPKEAFYRFEKWN